MVLEYDLEVQAHLGDTAIWVPDHRNKVKIAIK